MFSTQNGRAGEPTAVPQQRQSERFFSTEGEIVVFRSSDNVLFNIHRGNLRAVTDGPFAEDFASSETDVADLTEHSDILEIVFQFVYPGNLPLLEDASSDLLFSVAEAAEKYRVAPAMALCHLNIKRIYDNFDHLALQKLAYAHKHGYTELLDEVALRSLKKSSKDALSVLGPGTLYIGWTLYKETRYDALRVKSRKWRMRDDHGLPKVKCEIWASLIYAIEEELSIRPYPWLDHLDMIVHQYTYITEKCQHRHDSGVTHCYFQQKQWVHALEKQMKVMPSLSRLIADVRTG